MVPSRVPRSFVAFLLAGIAHGLPFVLVAVEVERRAAGSRWLAAVAVARLAPYLVCSPVAGAVAGRHGLRRVVAATGIARAACAAGLGAALTAQAHVLVLVVLLAALVAVGTPTYPAMMTFLHDVAEPDRRDRLFTLAAAAESAAFWAGPALGGLLFAVAGGAAVVPACIALSAASAVLALTLGGDGAPASEEVGEAMQGALRCLVGTAVRPAMLAVIGGNVLAGVLAVLLVRLPVDADLGDGRAYGMLSFVQGLGAVVAVAALLGPVRLDRRPLAPLAVGGGAVALLAVGDLRLAALACAALGAATLATEVVVTATIGRAVPGNLVAPAFGMLDAGMVTAMIAGAALAPGLVAVVGLRPTLVLVGVATPLVAHRLRGPAVPAVPVVPTAPPVPHTLRRVL